MARPKKEAQAARQVRLNLRLTAEERAALDAAARSAGQSPSDYARMRALAVSGPARGAPRSIPALLDSAAIVALNRVGANLNQLARRVNAGDVLQPGELSETLAALNDQLGRIETLVMAAVDR